LRKEFPRLNLLLATYFEHLGDNAQLATSLPVDALHIDLVRAPQQLDEVLDLLPAKTILSLGLVDGRNIWKNDFEAIACHHPKSKRKLGNEGFG
jgi:5-methyltetrahydropteroyltriglutamate--homocysteine methyltransferase